MEETFRKFWSLKEAYTKARLEQMPSAIPIARYALDESPVCTHPAFAHVHTKARGDGLGFEFKRCDFALGQVVGGTAAQPVQLSSVVVDGRSLPLWHFYVQPLEGTRPMLPFRTHHPTTPPPPPAAAMPPLLTSSSHVARSSRGPVPADHWTSVARGPPTDIVDAHGRFKATFASLSAGGTDAPGTPRAEAALTRAEPPFVKKSIADLVADNLRDAYLRAAAS